MRVHELLGERGHAAIEAAVRSAERATSGEIVPVIVERSDDYTELRFGAAALVAFAFGGLALTLSPELSPWLIPTQVGVLFAGAKIFGLRSLLRWLIPRDVAEKRVARAASLAFHEAGLVETRERTGILIYVSLLERRVTVLADRGIDARVEPGTWDEVVARVVAGIAEGRAEAGLADGIARCGEILSQRFPVRADDLDELPNAPRGR